MPQAQCAVDDFKDISLCDALVMVESPGCRGAWAELGYAIAIERPVLLLPSTELTQSVFALHPGVETYSANGVKGIIAGLKRLQAKIIHSHAIHGAP